MSTLESSPAAGRPLQRAIKAYLLQAQRDGTWARTLLTLYVLVALIGETVLLAIGSYVHVWPLVISLMVLVVAAVLVVAKSDWRGCYTDAGLYLDSPWYTNSLLAPCARVRRTLLWKHAPYPFADLYRDAYTLASQEAKARLLEVCQRGTLKLVRLEASGLGPQNFSELVHAELSELYQEAVALAEAIRQAHQARLEAVEAEKALQQAPEIARQAAEDAHSRDLLIGTFEAEAALRQPPDSTEFIDQVLADADHHHQYGQALRQVTN